jgi:hypothetical protein
VPQPPRTWKTTVLWTQPAQIDVAGAASVTLLVTHPGSSGFSASASADKACAKVQAEGSKHTQQVQRRKGAKTKGAQSPTSSEVAARCTEFQWERRPHQGRGLLCSSLILRLAPPGAVVSPPGAVVRLLVLWPKNAGCKEHWQACKI